MDLGGLGGKVLLTKTSTNVDFQCDPRLGHPKLLDYEHGVSDNRPQRFFGGSFEPSLHQEW